MAASLAVPAAKLAKFKSLLAGGASASIAFEVSGPDGVATTCALTSAAHLERVAALWTAAHSLPAVSPDPLAATREACNALGKQLSLAAEVAREAAALAAEEEALAARRSALAAKQAGLSSPKPVAAGAASAAAPEPEGASARKKLPAGGAKRAAEAHEEAEEHGEEEDEEDEEEAPRKRAKPVQAKVGGEVATSARTGRLLTRSPSPRRGGEPSVAGRGGGDGKHVGGCGKKAGVRGSTATTTLWKTYAKWNPDKALPISPPGRGRTQAAEAGETKVKKSKKGAPAAPVAPADDDANEDIF